MANDKREGMYYKHSLTGADCWDRQGFSPARILSGSSSRVSSAGSNLDGAVNGPAGMVTSLVAAVYIAGLGLFTAGPASNQGEPLLVSAAGMTAAAAFAVTVEIVPECRCIKVLAARPALTLTYLLAHIAQLRTLFPGIIAYLPSRWNTECLDQNNLAGCHCMQQSCGFWMCPCWHALCWRLPLAS